MVTTDNEPDPYLYPIGRVVECRDVDAFAYAVGVCRQPAGGRFPPADDNGVAITPPTRHHHMWIVFARIAGRADTKLNENHYVCALCMKHPGANIGGVKSEYVPHGYFGVVNFTRIQFAMVAALPARWIKNYSKTDGSASRTYDVPADNGMLSKYRQAFVNNWKPEQFGSLLKAHSDEVLRANAIPARAPRVRVKPRAQKKLDWTQLEGEPGKDAEGSPTGKED